MNYDKVFVLDNGADSIKAGFEGECKIFPNFVSRAKDKRVYISDAIETCHDFAGMTFRRPFERGYLVNWESEAAIWGRLFDTCKVDPDSTALVLTEAPFCPPQLQTACDQMVFEEYSFEAAYRCVGSSLVSYNDHRSLYEDLWRSQPSECVLVIDSGYSFTHVTPIINGIAQQSNTTRMNIGGKVLTNLLKEVISFRHYNMMDEFYLINQVKEDVSFISTNFSKDLEIAQLKKNPLKVDYVLPGYSMRRRGYTRTAAEKVGEEEQVLTLSNERFTIPEIMFSPSDIGMKQAGIPEAVMQAIEGLSEDLQTLCMANIVLVGGNTCIDGFKERLQMELDCLKPQNATIRLGLPNNPMTYVWEGGVNLGNHETFDKICVTKAAYQEHGSSRLSSRPPQHDLIQHSHEPISTASASDSS